MKIEIFRECLNPTCQGLLYGGYFKKLILSFLPDISQVKIVILNCKCFQQM